MAGFFLREQFFIEGGEDFHRAIIEDGDIAGIVGPSVSESDHARARERKSAAATGAQGGSKVIGDFLAGAVGRTEADFRIALIIVAEVDATPIRSPLWVLDVAVELVGEGVRASAVAVHEIEFGGLM